jgi:hypothetical protein
MAFKNRKDATAERKNQSQTQQTAQSEFPDPSASVKLPRKPWLAVVREWCLNVGRAIFSPSAGMLIGYGIALGSVAGAVVGYYTIANAVAVPLGFAKWTIFGLNIIPLALGTAAALTIQYKEIAPRKFEIFPHLADRAAYKAGQEQMVDPRETANTASMLPTYKHMARNGDSIRDRKAKKESTICYVMEGVGAFTAIGFFLGSTNPVIQVAAVFWGAFSVFGCEYGLGNAEKAAAECLTATQERNYRVEKSRLQQQAS